jgi:hypothetical protein
MNTALDRSNSLADLAARIRGYHDKSVAALRSSVGFAMDAGDLLIEAKAQLKHGQWLAWLAGQCTLSERMAQRYIRLARNRAFIETKSDKLSDLTVNGALALLTVPREALDDDLVEAFVGHLDQQEVLTNVLRSQAEIARRGVVLERAERNLDATKEIMTALGIDHGKPVCEEVEKFFAEESAKMDDVIAAYDAAVMSDDYDRAFALAEWLHEFTVEVLEIAQQAEAT